MKGYYATPPQPDDMLGVVRVTLGGEVVAIHCHGSDDATMTARALSVLPTVYRSRFFGGEPTVSVDRWAQLRKCATDGCDQLIQIPLRTWGTDGAEQPFYEGEVRCLHHGAIRNIPGYAEGTEADR
jgi:hypothetical protein